MELFEYADGRALADRAMRQAEDHANSVHGDWTSEANDHLRSFIKSRRGAPFMAEDVRRYAEDKGLSPPPDQRAWGSVMRRASAGKVIRKVGYGESRNAQAHCRPTVLWTSDCY